MRNLDITTLRSFVAIADVGGVTRAAAVLHLTQSAVSMQIKRLEDMLGVTLLDRRGRTVTLTATGEQLLVHARRMVALNDEVMARLTDQVFEGDITLGVPHDIVYPHIPQVLKQFNAAFPRMRVHLVASFTSALKDQYARGTHDIILTTETEPGRDGETLASKDLVWIGAPGGVAWCKRPLRLAFSRHCGFRPLVAAALDEAGIAWDITIDTDSDRSIEAAVSADLGIQAMIDGAQPPYLERIDHRGELPILPKQQINLYGGRAARSEVHSALAEFLRQAFAQANGGKRKASHITPVPRQARRG